MKRSAHTMNRIHIVLAGAMGSGKTTLGTELSERLGRPFFDSDRQIETVHGATGRELTARNGVAWLHAAEAKALNEALDRPDPAVVAAAASIADDPDSLARLTDENVFVVLLDAPTDILAERAENQGHRRAFDWEGMAGRMRDRTERLTQVADVVIDVGSHDPGEAADTVLAAFSREP